MTNNFLALGALIAFGWVFANALPSEPTSRAITLRATTTAPAPLAFRNEDGAGTRRLIGIGRHVQDARIGSFFLLESASLLLIRSRLALALVSEL